MPESDFDRGHAEGYNAAEMAEFRRHFGSINGSVEETAKRLQELTLAISTLGEEIRRDKQAVTVRADTLATETETRRAALADAASSGDRRFTRGQAMAGIGIGAIGATLALLAALGGHL
jgi:methyl-accepting chemotaxis protein